MARLIDGNEKAGITPDNARKLIKGFLKLEYGSLGKLTSALRRRGVERTIGSRNVQQFVGLGVQTQQAFEQAAQELAQELDGEETGAHQPIVLTDTGYGREVHVATGTHAPKKETGQPPSITVVRRRLS